MCNKIYKKYDVSNLYLNIKLQNRLTLKPEELINYTVSYKIGRKLNVDLNFISSGDLEKCVSKCDSKLEGTIIWRNKHLHYNIDIVFNVMCKA